MFRFQNKSSNNHDSSVASFEPTTLIMNSRLRHNAIQLCLTKDGGQWWKPWIPLTFFTEATFRRTSRMRAIIRDTFLPAGGLLSRPRVHAGALGPCSRGFAQVANIDSIPKVNPYWAYWGKRKSNWRWRKGKWQAFHGPDLRDELRDISFRPATIYVGNHQRPTQTTIPRYDNNKVCWIQQKSAFGKTDPW